MQIAAKLKALSLLPTQGFMDELYRNNLSIIRILDTTGNSSDRSSELAPS